MRSEIHSTFKNKRVLITGGLGFIGSNLARKLVELGAQATLVDNLVPEYGGNLFNISGIKNKVQIHVSDIRDERKMKDLIQGQDYLFNLAGQSSHMDSMRDPYADLAINANAQLFVLEACRKYNPAIKIVFASTRQIYGKPQYLPVDEKHPICPVDINGVNKFAGEWYHVLYNNVYGISSCVLRLTNTYGPRMRVKDARQTFVGVWINRLIKGEAFEIWGGEQLRDFTYVDDAVNAMLLAAADKRADGQIFNLGGDCSISLRKLAELLIELNGSGKYSAHTFPPEYKKIDIGDYYSDFQKIQHILGWKPEISLRDGLIKTMAFYREYLQNYL